MGGPVLDAINADVVWKDDNYTWGAHIAMATDDPWAQPARRMREINSSRHLTSMGPEDIPPTPIPTLPLDTAVHADEQCRPWHANKCIKRTGTGTTYFDHISGETTWRTNTYSEEDTPVVDHVTQERLNKARHAILQSFVKETLPHPHPRHGSPVPVPHPHPRES